MGTSYIKGATGVYLCIYTYKSQVGIYVCVCVCVCVCACVCVCVRTNLRLGEFIY